MNRKSLLELGRAVLEIEAAAVNALIDRLDDGFARACELLLACKGRIVVTGMGKSGHIGHKIAATLASTGSPAFFVHPGEASHGDLGMITRQDAVLALSYSGETAELTLIVPMLKRLGVPLVAMTGNAESTLAKSADEHLDISVAEEACPLGLAPTSSTTATLAMGDALAIALLEARGFTRDDFARSHPGGTLGRRLLLHVENIMHTGDAVPRVEPGITVAAALVEMTSKGLGMTVVCGEDGRVAGVFTDGDLRRTLDRRIDLHETAISEVMTADCRTAKPDMLAAEALMMMEKHSINGLPVVDDGGILVGALNMHDMLRAGVL